MFSPFASLSYAFSTAVRDVLQHVVHRVEFDNIQNHVRLLLVFGFFDFFFFFFFFANESLSNLYLWFFARAGQNV
jgi:hypothetical protein